MEQHVRTLPAGEAPRDFTSRVFTGGQPRGQGAPRGARPPPQLTVSRNHPKPRRFLSGAGQGPDLALEGAGFE